MTMRGLQRYREGIGRVDEIQSHPNTLFDAVLSHRTAGCEFRLCKSTDALEKAICSDPPLSAADDELNAAWKSALKTFPLPAFLRTSQQFWLKETATCAQKGQTSS